MLWTANTERYADVIEGINDTPENFLAAVAANHAEVAPSQLYALASVLEGCPFINGSPQNTFVPGLLRLAVEKGVLVGGDDFKSGQTKMKSVLVDFLVGAGIKPTSIVSYNHLGNNDGKNLSAPQTFRSKEISKANVVDDMVREREGGGGGEEDEERAFFLIEFLSFFSRDASPEKERKNLNLQKKKKTNNRSTPTTSSTPSRASTPTTSSSSSTSPPSGTRRGRWTSTRARSSW